MASGGARERAGRFYANVRFGKGRRLEMRVPWATTLEQATARAELCAEAAEKLASINRRDLVSKLVKKLAAAASNERAAKLVKAIDAIARGAVKAGAAHDITYGEWSDLYTSGELARLHPDYVKARDMSDDISRSRLYIYKHVRDIPVADFELSHALTVMSALPPMSDANRRQVAQIMGRLMHLAVFPGKIIKASPLPRGWLPKVKKRKHYSCLFPAEEQQLLEAKEVPEVFRLFCGVLDREGMRLSMVLDSDWWQWGAQHFTQTKNKTDDPHMVAVRPDTAAAMAEWRRRQVAAGKGDVRPFAGVLELVATEKQPNGDRTKIAAYYRDALKTAGVTRAELHASTEHTGKLRAHDMRATFVTVSLAEGKSETWIRDRTSHKSTAMIDRYRRMARQYETLELGSLCDLGSALGWWKRGGKGPGNPGPKSKVGSRKCTGRDSNPHVSSTAEPKSPQAREPVTDDLLIPGKATSRNAANGASTSLPPPYSRSVATSHEGEADHIAHDLTSNRPGPVRAEPRSGPPTAAEERLLDAQAGVATLTAGWDALERQAASFGASKRRGRRSGR